MTIKPELTLEQFFALNAALQFALAALPTDAPQVVPLSRGYAVMMAAYIDMCVAYGAADDAAALEQAQASTPEIH